MSQTENLFQPLTKKLVRRKSPFYVKKIYFDRRNPYYLRKIRTLFHRYDIVINRIEEEYRFFRKHGLILETSEWFPASVGYLEYNVDITKPPITLGTNIQIGNSSS